MKSRTVILLWLIAIALGITSYFVKFHHQETNTTHTALSPGDLLLPNLPIRKLSKVTLSQGDDSTTLIRGKNNIWTVQERGNYPANHELLRNLLGTLGQLKIMQGYPCTSQYFGRFGVAEKSKTSSDVGVNVSLFTSNDKKIADVFLGKYNGATKKSMGRFIRLARDTSGVYTSGETFPGVYADPPTWLDPAFLKIKHIKSIELKAPADPTFEAWKISRTSPKPASQFKLSDLKTTETMKLLSTGKLKFLFFYTSFQDVVDATRAKKIANPDPKLKRTAIIQTFDGLTYTIHFWPKKQKKESATSHKADSPLPAAEPAYLFTVDLSGDLPDTRQKSTSETKEETQKKDAAFAKLKEYVQFIKSLHNRIFQVGHTVIDPLKKSRKDFIAPVSK